MAASSVVLDGVPVAYTDVGSGPPLVFVHGAYVTGRLWDDVIAVLSERYRCIAPTWPFGAQQDPVGSQADLGVQAAGRRISGLLDALDLGDATLIANDSGGGIVLSALGDPDLSWHRVGRLVFTNCDSYEHFPPKSFAPLVKLCRISAVAGGAMLRLLATGPGRSYFVRAVTRNGLATDRHGPIFGGFMHSAAVRREAVRFTAALHPRHTTGAEPAIKNWTKPVLMLWGDSDQLFPVSHAQRLVDDFPNATLHVVDGSATYVMLDRPAETAAAIRDFVN
ncbi:alpha/beta fold hydrolase [Mycolicibacterium sp. XJ1819]